MQNRRKFLTHSSLALGALTFLKPLNSIAGEGGSSSTQNSLTILFTNGLGGEPQVFSTHDSLDAIRKTVTAVRREQCPVLLVDSGNILNASSEKSISDLHAFKAVKELNFDAIVPGNTDLQHGSAYFAKLVNRSNVPAVATNFPANADEPILSSRIVRKGRRKIGILAVGSTGNNAVGNAVQIIAAINNKARQLKERQACQLVVCLSHLPLQEKNGGLDSFTLSQQSANIDVVISSNDRRFTYNTHLLKNRDGYDVLVSHAGEKGAMLGRLDILFSENGGINGITARQIFTGESRESRMAAFRQHAAEHLA